MRTATAPELARRPAPRNGPRLADVADVAGLALLAGLVAAYANPDPAGPDVRAVMLDVMTERDTARAGLRDAECRAYASGVAEGQRSGYGQGWAACEAHYAARWRNTYRPPADKTWAELEVRRWGPGGRAAFGQPRPGDFPGGRPVPPTYPPADQSAGTIRTRTDAP